MFKVLIPWAADDDHRYTGFRSPGGENSPPWPGRPLIQWSAVYPLRHFKSPIYPRRRVYGKISKIRLHGLKPSALMAAYWRFSFSVPPFLVSDYGRCNRAVLSWALVCNRAVLIWALVWWSTEEWWAPDNTCILEHNIKRKSVEQPGFDNASTMSQKSTASCTKSADCNLISDISHKSDKVSGSLIFKISIRIVYWGNYTHRMVWTVLGCSVLSFPLDMLPCISLI